MSKNGLVFSILKYLIILSLLFLIFFLFVYFYNIIPLFKLTPNFKEVLAISLSLMTGIIFYSLNASIILSLFIYILYIYNKQKKNKILFFFIPLFIPILFVSLYLLILKPDVKNINLHDRDDARFYFSKGSFFTYQDNTFYFENIEKNQIINACIIKDDSLKAFPVCDILFKANSIWLNFIRDNIIKTTIVIPKDDFDKINIHSKLIDLTIKNTVSNALANYLFSQNTSANLIYWFATILLLLTILTTIKIQKFRLLNFVYYLIVLYFFFPLNVEIFKLYHYISTFFILDQIILDFMLGLSLIIGSLIILGLRYIIQKMFLLET